VKRDLTVAGIVFIITTLLMYFLMEQVFSARLASAPRDTTIVTHPEYTLPYVAQGPVVSKPKLPPTVIKPSAPSIDSAFNNCEHTVLVNTIADLYAQLAEYRDVDSFTEDSLRYSLAVTWDGSKEVNQRFWRWLEIKPYPYSDTTSLITQTIALPGKMSGWQRLQPWGCS
jgi:hypothetical protein